VIILVSKLLNVILVISVRDIIIYQTIKIVIPISMILSIYCSMCTKSFSYALVTV
jgi:hypothetical protein